MLNCIKTYQEQLNSTGLHRATAAAANSLLNNCYIPVFSFARVYDDGRCLFLSNQPSLFEFLYETQTHITAHVPHELIQQDFWYLIKPNDLRYSSILRTYREKFGAKVLVDYIQRKHGYYDQFAFGHVEEYGDAINFFLNTRDSLERMSQEFRDKLAKELSKASPLSLLEPMRPNIKGLAVQEEHLSLDKEIQALSKNWTKIRGLDTLTPRELECLKFLVLGCTAKDTALALGLSFRTVESYLDSVKAKLGYITKSEIIQKLRSDHLKLLPPYSIR